MRPELSFAMTVRYSDAGADGLARLAAVGDWLQEAAGRSADLLHFGEGDLLQRGLTWVLVRQKLDVRRLPAAGEELRMRTWPSVYNRLGYRGYALYDAADEKILDGVSAWAVMDLTSRAMCPLPEEFFQEYPDDVHPVAPFSCKVLPRVKTVEASCPLRMRHDDVDLNGHVNNARYLSLLAECLPAAERSSLSLLDVTFRAETFPEEEVLAVCGPAEAEEGGQGCRRALALRRPTGEDVCRALFAWPARAEG